MSTNENCSGIIAQRYIITKDIEETSRDHPIFREFTARGGFRTVFQGLDSVPACVVAFVAVFASSAYYGHGFLYAILEFAMLTACLQIGYASGLLSSSIPGTWRRLRNPRESSRPVASMAATRHR